MFASPVPITRAAPGDPWWEFELHHALVEGDVNRLNWLVQLAEAGENKVAQL